MSRQRPVRPMTYPEYVLMALLLGVSRVADWWHERKEARR